MIPPTSIDGTDITGATIDGTDVTEITVDGDVVFSAGPDFPLVVDDFESGNLNDYTNTSGFTISSSVVAEGSNSLELQNPDNIFDMYSDFGDGLNAYPQKGQKFSVLIYDSNTTQPVVLFGVDGSAEDGYGFQHIPDSNFARLYRVDGGSRTDLLSANISLNKSEWYEYEIQWHDGSGSESDNTIEMSIFEIDAGLNRTSQIYNDSVVDSTYPNNRGVGYADTTSTPSGSGFIDNYKIIGTVD